MTAVIGIPLKGIEEFSAILPLQEEIPDDQASRIMAWYLNQDGLLIQSFSAEARENPYLAEVAIRNNPLSLKFCSKSIRENPAMVKLACSLNGFAYFYASDDLKLNEEIFNQAFESIIENDPSLLYGFVHKAVLENADILKFLKGFFDDDRDIAFLAVEQDPFMIKHVSYRLKKDPMIFKVAFDHFCVIAEEHKEEFLEDLSQHSLHFLNFLKDELKADLELVKRCFNTYLDAHVEFEREFLDLVKTDTILLETICQFNPDFFQNAHPALKNDEAFAIHMIQNAHSRIFEFLDDALKAHPTVALVACREEGGNLFYAKGDISSRKEIVEAACNNDPVAYFFASVEVQRQAPLAASILKHLKHEFKKSISEALINDKEFWQQIIAIDPSLQKFVPIEVL